MSIVNWQNLLSDKSEGLPVSKLRNCFVMWICVVSLNCDYYSQQWKLKSYGAETWCIIPLWIVNAARWRPFQFLIMKKSTIVSTGTKLVRVPLLPILWVRHLSDGSAVASLALIRLLNSHLFNNWGHGNSMRCYCRPYVCRLDLLCGNDNLLPCSPAPWAQPPPSCSCFILQAMKRLTENQQDAIFYVLFILLLIFAKWVQVHQTIN